MHPKHHLLLLLTTLLTTITPTQACTPQLPSRNTNTNNKLNRQTSFPAIQPGTDTPPPSPSTAGYFINHAALNVHNLTRSVAWYRDVLGFQVLFTFRASPRYSVVYLGHSGGPATACSEGDGSGCGNGSGDGSEKEGYQSAAELTELMMSGRAAGLLELVHFEYSYHRSDSESAKLTGGGGKPTGGGGKPGTSPRLQRFSHLGLAVPDILQFQERLESLGVEVLKRFGEQPDLSGPAGEAFGLPIEDLSEVVSDEEVSLISAALLDVLLVLDPDGNLVEVQELRGGGL